MRKGQLLGHIVIFVIGLIVVGAVVLFGYSILKNLDEDRCNVADVQFATQLSTLIDRNRGWGTSKLVTLDPPCETQRVCFVDRRLIDAYGSGESPSLTWTESPGERVENVIESSVRSNDQTNVFTVRIGGNVLPVERFSAVAAPIQVSARGSTSPAMSCVPIEGDALRIRMEGTGSVVRISDG